MNYSVNADNSLKQQPRAFIPSKTSCNRLMHLFPTQTKAAGASAPCSTTIPSQATSNTTPVAPPSSTTSPAAGGSSAAGFPWWIVVASVGGASLIACSAFFVAAAYRRRKKKEEEVAEAAAMAAASRACPGMVIVELSEDDISTPSVSIALAD